MRARGRLTVTDRAATEQRLRALGEAIAAYEREFGEFTEAEVAAQSRADRRRATVVRPRKVARRT